MAQVRAAADRAVGRHCRAAEDGPGDRVDRVRQRGDRGRGDDAVLRQAAHGVHGDGRPVEVEEPCLAVVEPTLDPVEVEEGAAQVVAALRARRALPAGHEEGACDALADGQPGVVVAGAELDDLAGDLVPEDARQGEGDGPADDVQVRVAQSAGARSHEDLAGARPRRADLLDLQSARDVAQDRGAHGRGNVRSHVVLRRLKHRWFAPGLLPRVSSDASHAIRRCKVFVRTNCRRGATRRRPGCRGGGSSPGGRGSGRTPGRPVRSVRRSARRAAPRRHRPSRRSSGRCS